MNTSSIDWLAFPGYQPATWSPWIGCSKISSGCRSCWAAREEDGRFRHLGRCALTIGYDPLHDPYFLNGPVYQGDKVLEEPLHAHKPRAIFVCPRSDLFHEKIPFSKVDAVMAIISLTPRHLYVICTKRARRMHEYMAQVTEGPDWTTELFEKHYTWPLPNLILMVTVESQAEADERIPHLLQCPAVCHAVSHEPALGPLNLSAWLTSCSGCPTRVAWLICGAENAKDARPMKSDWVREDRAQCAAAEVPFFYKQSRDGKKINHHPLLDGRAHRELPEVRK